MSGKKQEKPREDLTGGTYGCLKVVGMERGQDGFVAVCRCLRCGSEPVNVVPARLKRGHTRSCGCLGRGQKQDYVGQRFGHLEVKSIRAEYKPDIQKFRYFAICRCHNCDTDNYEVLMASLKRGSTTSCGCRRDQYDKMRGDKHCQFTGYKEIRGKKWSDYKKKAAIRGLTFDIRIEDAWGLYEEQDERCALTGLPIRHHLHNGGGTASLDRIDSKKGYSLGNVQWVHKDVNRMKMDLEQNHFIDLCCLIAEKHHANSVC